MDNLKCGNGRALFEGQAGEGLGQKSCRTKVSRIFLQIFVPNFAPNFPRIC